MTTRPISRVLATTAVVLLAAGTLAVGQASAAAPAKKDVTLTITVLPAQVRLLEGEAVKVRLSTNRTTGYSWSTKVSGDGGAVSVSKGKYTAPTTDLVGAPGLTTWTITAKGNGIARVTIVTTPPGGGTAQTVGVVTVYAGSSVTKTS